MGDGFTFMQDNTPIHTARIVKVWFCESGFNIMEWPPYSPDLNPIKHAWAKLKEMIDRLDPNLDDLIEQAWCQIGDDYFNRLAVTMKNCVEAIIQAEGWYTKY
ncbi:hypothetical protein N7454_007167 [Penicillium verhagenii]|nr:hypothetical protein N7454_007167 [Penicillium verhagenii]